MRIGLISDTHGHIDNKVLKHLEGCDEIWHAGDIGDLSVTDALSKIAPLRAVYGNIDGHDVRSEFPKDQIFTVNRLKIWITHIGGRPPKFARGILPKIQQERPDIFVCGHSHILIAKWCKDISCLHLNPGAIGNYGIHKVRTIMRFDITSIGVADLEIIEIPRNKGK
jgi:putative phosphoesterase